MSTSWPFMSGICANRCSSRRESWSVVCCRSRCAWAVASAACSASPARMSRSTSRLRTSLRRVPGAPETTATSTMHPNEIVTLRDMGRSPWMRSLLPLRRCENYTVARIAALDVGERRIGVAISDVTQTLARPVGVIRTSGLDADALDRAVAELTRLAAEEDGLATLGVRRPRRLDGSPNDMTPRVQAFAERLRERTDLPIVLQDERLT